MRILRPLKSSTEFISLLNQPPHCTPVLPAISGFRLNSAPSSSQSAWPPA